MFREQLIGRVSKELATQALIEIKPKRETENRTSKLRKELGHQRRLQNDSSMNSLGI